ncbi:hypothetical protein PHLCEN_2v3311 [Hermanssonia centrifuga]|uniref:Uncharacterized protein n=1 Tax=Hermanssonia centrifuga TaxID=98765 RepID=A0A2R6QM61_9APHY|nr:hypothetical protein PHLCEN_2v3311 [Hermanssonia centrifuga]
MIHFCTLQVTTLSTPYQTHRVHPQIVHWTALDLNDEANEVESGPITQRSTISLNNLGTWSNV